MTEDGIADLWAERGKDDRVTALAAMVDMITHEPENPIYEGQLEEVIDSFAGEMSGVEWRRWRKQRAILETAPPARWTAEGRQAHAAWLPS